MRRGVQAGSISDGHADFLHPDNLFQCRVRQADSLPAFIVQPADGKAVEGPLRELGPDWSVRVGDGARVDGGDVLTVRRSGRPLPPLPAGRSSSWPAATPFQCGRISRTARC